MQVHDFHAEDLVGQIEGLVSQLESERRARLAAEAEKAGTLGLIDIVSKKLRPPMESVTALTDRILSGPLSIGQRRDAEALAHSMHRILGALTEVLDFSTLENGDADFAVESFDFHALVREAASALQACASGKGLTSSVDMAANCPRYLIGDAMRVRQVLMALMDTSIQSTAEGSIRLYVSVNDAVSPVTVRFDITDTSPGLTPEEQLVLFEPTTDMKRSDGGLGLAIARRVAEGLGGGVACDSAMGQGSLYWFTFKAVVPEEVAQPDRFAMALVEPVAEPVVEQPAQETCGLVEPALTLGGGTETNVAQDAMHKSEPAKQEVPQAAPHKVHKPAALQGHVLLMEDNTVNRMLIGAYLDEFGLTFDVAETGAAALLCLDQRHYDLVLMDTVLPDYRGVQMAQRIRSLESQTAHVPIVALAAVSETEDEDVFVEAGVNAAIDKPIQGRELYAALVPLLPAEDELAWVLEAADSYL